MRKREKDFRRLLSTNVLCPFAADKKEKKKLLMKKMSRDSALQIRRRNEQTKQTKRTSNNITNKAKTEALTTPLAKKKNLQS